MPWRKSLDKRQQKSESTQQGMRTPINQSFMHPHPQLMMTRVKNKGTDKSSVQIVLPPAERIRVQVAQDTASLSSSPWIQRASSVPAPSGLLSDYDRGPGSGFVSVIP